MKRKPARPSRRPVKLLQPEPGRYRYRTGKGQPWLPALVYEVQARDPDTYQIMDRAPVLACTIDGKDADLDRVWGSLHPVDQREYDQLCRNRLYPVDDLDLMNSRPAL